MRLRKMTNNNICYFVARTTASILLFMCILMPAQVNAIGITKEIATDFVAKIQNVMNNKNPQLVQQFFDYYSVPEARFIRTTYEVDPDNPNKPVLSNSGINLSKQE